MQNQIEIEQKWIANYYNKHIVPILIFQSPNKGQATYIIHLSIQLMEPQNENIV
jgi:hypothetical protein